MTPTPASSSGVLHGAGQSGATVRTCDLEKAAKTWNGDWWKLGGGGTVWDSIVYDPQLDTII